MRRTCAGQILWTGQDSGVFNYTKGRRLSDSALLPATFAAFATPAAASVTVATLAAPATTTAALTVSAIGHGDGG